jgi:hypothetical protein
MNAGPSEGVFRDHVTSERSGRQCVRLQKDIRTRSSLVSRVVVEAEARISQEQDV